jgi:hypothetical protein
MAPLPPGILILKSRASWEEPGLLSTHLSCPRDTQLSRGFFLFKAASEWRTGFEAGHLVVSMFAHY